MNSNREIFRLLTYISQFAINMIVPIFVCSFVGLYIDRHFDTQCWFIILFFAGAIAGCRNVYVLAKKSINRKEDSHHEE